MTQNNTIVASIVVALLVVAGAAFFFSGPKGGLPSARAGEYDTFAQCLYDSGLRMYGSATCSFCAKQRALFGPSVRFIREIECDPRNPLPETERCIAKKITGTPTWIKEDANGNDVYRFPAGVVPLEDLSTVSGCPFVKDGQSEAALGDAL